MASSQKESANPSLATRAPGSKPGENMLWGGRFTGMAFQSAARLAYQFND